MHDIGYQIVRNDAGEVGFAVYVGGGQGRTPLDAPTASATFLPKADLLAYTNSILRIYNLEGRRDNKYKARIKILVHEKGADVDPRRLSRRISPTNREDSLTLPQAEMDRIIAYFAMPGLTPHALLDVRDVRGPQARATRPSRSSRQAQRVPAQGARPRHHHDLAEADRRHPGRRLVPRRWT